MSLGDSLMAIGHAWQRHLADPLHRPVAIGDGKSIEIPPADLSLGLDFLATQQQLDSGMDLNWVISFRGHRDYIDHEAMHFAVQRCWWLRNFGGLKSKSDVGKLGRFIFNRQYRAAPAPIRLTPAEQAITDAWERHPFVVIEPFTKPGAPPGKQWPIDRFAELVDRLKRFIRVYQLSAPESPTLPGLERLPSPSFRESMAYLKAARLYIGPEGGLHHAAAAMGTPAVVLFGGYVPVEVTGYDFHVNLTGGSPYACGIQRGVCRHCQQAMDNITVIEVEQHARRLLSLGSGTLI